MKAVFSFETFLAIDQNTQTSIPEGHQHKGFTGVKRSFRLSSRRYIVVEMSGNYIDKIQQDATVCRYLFTANILYMFRVSTAPIIRSK